MAVHFATMENPDEARLNYGVQIQIIDTETVHLTRRSGGFTVLDSQTASVTNEGDYLVGFEGTTGVDRTLITRSPPLSTNTILQPNLGGDRDGVIERIRRTLLMPLTKANTDANCMVYDTESTNEQTNTARVGIDENGIPYSPFNHEKRRGVGILV